MDAFHFVEVIRPPVNSMSMEPSIGRDTGECRYEKQNMTDDLADNRVDRRNAEASGATRIENRIHSPTEQRPNQRLHSCSVGGKTYQWDVETLWRLAKSIQPSWVPIDSILGVDENCWFTPSDPPSIRNVALHARRIEQADMAFPIILNVDGALMDGGHRVAKAIMQGQTEILAIRFSATPEPDRIVDEAEQNSVESARFTPLVPREP